ncbi:MerR family transcriptional regulator [Agromyces mangrovi Wang et al. 2018]|uniref:MerR family transcriptional regulator n=1 Tax=Agromyces mangrovi TaxID=1858653 RepID=UPI00257280C3|nr:MerR family transcriptional regulator [Agromyces mangrovi]
MYTIGEFAAFGHVSARMLRHYDAIGLLAPAHVDEFSGYRRYALDQLADLLRITELRGYGCSLDETAAVLAADDPDAALRAALDRRRAELVASLARDASQLTRIDARLSALKGEATMADIEYRSIAPVTVYAASAVAPGSGPEHVSPVIDQVLPPLQAALQASGIEYREPGIFWYQPVAGTDDLRVWVSWQAGEVVTDGDGWEVIELPAVEKAATRTYRGEMTGIGEAWQALMQDAVADGAEFSGPCREVYVYAEGPQSEWITELQQPVR